MLKLFNLIFSSPENSVLYAGNYDFLLVTLSVAVAIFSSYAALLVSNNIVQCKRHLTRRLWLAGGGLCLGIGIWAMHFIGMLAFNLPCSSSYDARLTLLSMVPGILASMLALSLISRHEISNLKLVAGGVLLGSGIGAMHYAGMSAMRIDGLIRYDVRLFLISILVAVVLAILALWINFRLNARRSVWSRWRSFLSALVMGLAVSGMHYTAMAAAYFIRIDTPAVSNAGMSPDFLTGIVLAASCLIIIVTVVATFVRKSNLLSLGRAYKTIALFMVIWTCTAWLGADYYYSRRAGKLYQQEVQLAAQQAENIVHSISENIDLLKGISRVFSRDDQVKLALRSAIKMKKHREVTGHVFGEIDRSLQISALNLGADNIFVLNTRGDCIAAANAGDPSSPMGANFADRAYFPEVKAGRSGRQYAVGRTSNVPGLYYASPVFENGRFLGAVVVKRDITKFISLIKQSRALISDANGVIVLSYNQAYLFHAMPNASVTAMTAGQRLLQYKRAEIEPLQMKSWGKPQFGAAVLMGDKPQVLVSKALPDDEIVVHVPRSVGILVRLSNEKYWLFLLLAATGSMLIIAVSVVVIYLRDSLRAAADLRVSATAFDSQEGMFVTDAEGVIQRVNNAFTQLTGYSASEVVGQTPRLLSSGQHDAVFYTLMWQSINETGKWAGEIWNRRKNGEIYPEYLAITAVKDEAGIVNNYVATFNDISDSKAATNEIQVLAFYDALTGLPNRRLLLDRLLQALASCVRSNRMGALLLIDLDNFKTLNDTMGHDIGDLLLRQVAERLTACVRNGDTVARLGGDEFIVMLEEIGTQTLDSVTHTTTIAEKILNSLNLPYRLEKYECHSTPSIGATLFSGNQQSADELMKQVDIAMYQAKQAGRNGLRFFDSKMQDAISARASLEADLRVALINSEFELHYQIQVNNLGAALGAEVLIRWMHPQRGMVSPAQFIPLAEENGLILPVGEWVLKTACDQLKLWQDNVLTRELTLAVNVSSKQFRQAGFVELVKSMLQSSGANPSLLKLELTESLLLENVDEIIAKMNELKLMGIHFSIDDFGTGYSSLQYIKRLPLDQLKIDQSFVRDIMDDTNDAAIVQTIIAMSNALGLNVIAEGVETREQRAFLDSHGCHTFQGYLFSKPIPLEQFEILLATNNTRP
ncbi:MAG: EAL domain-containing protein [Gallionella sp.]|nr:EAL domain-containing protein [Gallionella sp.]